MSNNNNIMATIAVITALALLTLIVPQTVLLQSAEAAPKPKVIICHVPEDAPLNATSKNLPLPAATAHLRNHEGDFPGPCPTDVPPIE